jgi:hypothetical protein
MYEQKDGLKESLSLQAFFTISEMDLIWVSLGYNVQGVSIRQMYNALTPQATNMNYIDELLNQNAGLNFVMVQRILLENTPTVPRCDI